MTDSCQTKTIGGAVNCCAMILAGGLNSRMGGRNKALLDVGGRRIVDRLVDVLTPLFDEILLVAREPSIYNEVPVKVVQDVFEARSSLTGIHAGLLRARALFGLVVPCDAPFLQTDLVRVILEEISSDSDVVIPRIDSYYQPLCAVYSKKCIPYIEDMLKRNDFKIINFFDKIRLKTIPLSKIMNVDPRQRSFVNVNTPEAYQAYKDTL
jgi:molybdopterin-guanine dinucleotide biosynthesis protein A